MGSWQCDANNFSQKFDFVGNDMSKRAEFDGGLIMGPSRIRWGTTGKCVDVKKGLDQNGTIIHIWTCDETNRNQKFNIIHWY